MRHTDRLKYTPIFQKEMDEERKSHQDSCESCQATKRKETSRITSLSTKVAKLDLAGRANLAEPFIITFCNKYPHYIDDLALELYISARVAFSRGYKMDTPLTVNLAYIITRLPEDSPMRKRCLLIYSQL